MSAKATAAAKTGAKTAVKTASSALILLREDIGSVAVLTLNDHANAGTSIRVH